MIDQNTPPSQARTIILALFRTRMSQMYPGSEICVCREERRTQLSRGKGLDRAVIYRAWPPAKICESSCEPPIFGRIHMADFPRTLVFKCDWPPRCRGARKMPIDTIVACHIFPDSPV